MSHERRRPLITAHNKRNLLKFPELFYQVNSYNGTHRELENIIKLINSYPEMSRKLLMSVKNSNCSEYVKQDYYKHIMLNVKPMYYSICHHYLKEEDV
jgi:hemoglobin-like flavoprotein